MAEQMHEVSFNGTFEEFMEYMTRIRIEQRNRVEQDTQSDSSDEDSSD